MGAAHRQVTALCAGAIASPFFAGFAVSRFRFVFAFLLCRHAEAPQAAGRA
jgi:hypothetical protein